MEGRLARWSPLSGIVFAVLFLVGSSIYDRKPSIDASDQEIVSFYADSGNQIELQVAYFALTLAAVFLVWFVGVLYANVRKAEGAESWLARVVPVSGAASVAVMLTGFIMGGMVADIGDDTDAFTVDPDTTRLLEDASYTFVFETALPLAAPMVLAASLVFLRTRALPRWLGWAGMVVAVSCLVGFLGVPMALFLLWISAVAVSLIRRPVATAVSRNRG